MLVLAIDTATAQTSVAVGERGGVLAAQRQTHARRHAEVLVPMVDDVLQAARFAQDQVELIVVDVGPGAYTGLRVGIATAQALGFALGVPVRGVLSVDVLAAGSQLAEPFTAAVDARRSQLFWASYAHATRRLDGPFVTGAEDVSSRTGPVVGGAGTPFTATFGDVREPSLPDAAHAVQLVVDAAVPALRDPVPVYLRRPDVTVSTTAASPFTS